MTCLNGGFIFSAQAIAGQDFSKKSNRYAAQYLLEVQPAVRRSAVVQSFQSLGPRPSGNHSGKAGQPSRWHNSTKTP
jgi:hypothetical protein